MGRVHRPARSREHRRRSGRASRATSPACDSRGRRRAAGRPAVPDRSAAVPGRGRSSARRARAARGRRSSARASELTRAERLSAENAMSTRGARTPRRRSPQESSAQVAAVERGAARRRAQPRVHPRDVADRRPGRPRHRHRRQPGLERSRRSDAADDGGVARSDLRRVRRRRADLPPLRRAGQRRPAASARQAALPIRMALAGDADFPHEGRLDFLDNQIDPTTGTIRGRAVFRNADRRPDARAVRAAAAARQRHLSRPARCRTAPSAPTSTSASSSSSTADRSVEYRPVTLGPLVDGLRVVRTGLAAGERVVVNGLQRVRPGVKVRAGHVAMDARRRAAAATPRSRRWRRAESEAAP